MNLKLLQSKLDRSDKKAIYVQIADLIIADIKKGVLKAGETMPGTRQMAAELSVNRNTVVSAFDILINSLSAHFWPQSPLADHEYCRCIGR